MLIVSTQCFPPAMGGIETLMYSLCSQLDRNGYELRVYADSYNKQIDQEFDHVQKFRILRYSGLKPWRRRKKSRDISRYSKNLDGPSLIADSWKSLEYLEPALFSKVLCLAHGTELPLNPGRSKAVRITESLNKASVIIANSSYTAGRIEKYTGADDRIKVIYPGINAPAVFGPDTDSYVRDIISGRHPVLISIARLEARKGLDMVLKIMPRVLQHYPGALYIIAGEGSLRPELETLARKLNIINHILFCGRLDEPFKSGYLQYSDLFIMPGTVASDDIEGFGIAFLEAAAHGVPAISGRTGGSAEAVLHEQTGLVCTAGDNEDLLNAVLEILGNEELRVRLGDNARERSRGFLWENRIKDYENLLIS